MKKTIFSVIFLSFVISCSNISKQEKEKYTKKGNEIVMQLNTLLSANLMNTMAKGKPHAVEFCNINAIPLTREIEEKNNAIIKRVSNKNRNPLNSPNKEEKEILSKYENGYKDIVIEKNDNSISYYKPIYLNQICLSCHGENKNIPSNVLTKIDSLYPNDKAKNYSLKDFRGTFHIKFNL